MRRLLLMVVLLGSMVGTPVLARGTDPAVADYSALVKKQVNMLVAETKAYLRSPDDAAAAASLIHHITGSAGVTSQAYTTALSVAGERLQLVEAINELRAAEMNLPRMLGNADEGELDSVSSKMQLLVDHIAAASS